MSEGKMCIVFEAEKESYHNAMVGSTIYQLEALLGKDFTQEFHGFGGVVSLTGNGKSVFFGTDSETNSLTSLSGLQIHVVEDYLEAIIDSM